MPNLSRVNINFLTRDGKNDTTVVHVFVKNRLNTTQTPETITTFIGSKLDHERYLPGGDLDDNGKNPYLGVGIGLAADLSFEPGEEHSFDLDLPPVPVDRADIMLPTVSVHILPDDGDRWIFTYTVTLSFDDGSFFDFSPADVVVEGVILDQDNKDYYAIGVENPFLPTPVAPVPSTTAVLDKITIDFATHNDDKNDSTGLDVRIGNRRSGGEVDLLAVQLDMLPGVGFDDGGFNSFTWSAGDFVGGDPIRLADLVLPVVVIDIHAGGDRWIFDYRVTMDFVDPSNPGQLGPTYVWQIGGVILDESNSRHFGVYNGTPFPTEFPPPAAPLTQVTPEQLTKRLPLPLLQRKLDEFINNRNGADDGHTPPLRKIRVHNTGVFNGDTLPETYSDVQSITARHEGVQYVSSPTPLGQISAFIADLGDAYVQNLTTNQLTVSIDPTSPTPFTIFVGFDCTPADEIVKTVGDDIDLEEFSITVKLTFDTDGQSIDVMSWLPELQNMLVVPAPLGGFRYLGTFLGQHVDQVSQESLGDLFVDQVVHVHQKSESIFGGILRRGIRDKIYGQLTSKDRFTGRNLRDSLNELATGWLIGPGVTNVGKPTFDGTDYLIDYTSPDHAFMFQQPADWPAGHDFTPGTLGHIDHIVVLTMENRSFDHILGYLRLNGRTDVDGLTGTESNSFEGVSHPVTRLTDTFFSPDPPHGYEPVHRAIDSGAMDGFVRSWAEQHGRAAAGQIMGYHTAATVPEYDALAVDFAIGHRWFAPHPGPTFPNRYYQLTGRPNIDPNGFWEFDDTAARPSSSTTIFDYLTAGGVTWAYYEQGYNFLRLFQNYTFDDEHIIDLRDSARGFLTAAQAGTLPSVSFVDPHFIELPPDANADGAPADIKDGQDFVNEIVEAVISGPAWNKTMLVIVYDEHGGFYDHVPPPQAPKASPELPIDTLGVRVPAFVITPWVARGTVFGDDHLVFDHTSLLKTIVRRFLPDRPPYLGARYAAANDLSAVLTDTAQPNLKFPPFVRFVLDYRPSGLRLGVNGDQAWQLTPDGSRAQEFSFENAGQGAFRIRSRVDGRYLTVDSTPSPTPRPLVLRPLDTSLPGQNLQRWTLDLTGSIQLQNGPNLVLQPVTPTQPGPVILGPHTFPPSSPDQVHVWTAHRP